MGQWLQRAFVVCLGLALAWGGTSRAAEPGPDAPRPGEELFRTYCANCHGERGVGDGPMAQILTVVPTNLTLLSRLNDGTFPTERVHQSIDGRKETPGHGSRRMPIWGLVFQEYDRDTNQEAEVSFRVRQLVAYLRSIQVE